MPARSPDLDDLILTIHSAGLAPDGWSRVGRELLKVLSAESGIGLRVSSHANPEPWAVLLNFDPGAGAAYAEHWGQFDPWYRGALRTGRIQTGLVSVDNQLVRQGEFESSAFFNDYLRPLDIGRMIQVCLAGSEPDGFGKASLNLYRGVGKAQFSSEDVKLLSILAPHLTVSARNYWTAESLRLLTSTQTNALDALTSAVFAIDRAGRLLFSNKLGEELIRQERWVRVLKGALVPDPTILGADRLAAEFHRASSGVGSSILVTDSSGAEAHVSITPIPPGLNRGFSTAAPSSLVWITPTAIQKDCAQAMARLFDLTPAERRILDRLIAGEELRQAATLLRISIHTARTQLKSIFRKTGRRSQSQLLLLAARIATLSLNQP